MEMPERKYPQINFTKAALSSLPLPAPSNKNGDGYYDTKVKNLCVRVYPSGKKTFTLIARYAGKPNKYKLGCFPETSVENARKAAQKTLNDIYAGINPRDAKRKKKQEITFGDYFKRHQKDGKYYKDTLADNEAYYRRYLERSLKNKRLSDIKRSDVENILTQVFSGGKKKRPYAANHVLVMVRTLYNRAYFDGYFAGVNPTIGIKKFKTTSREKFLDNVKIGYFIQSAQIDVQQAIDTNIGTEYEGYFYLLLLFIGQRKQNTLEMRWDQIIWGSATWHIPKTKNGKPHHARLNKQALDVLRAMKATSKSPWVFPKQAPSRKQLAKGESTREWMWEPRNAWGRILRRTRLLELVDVLAPHYDMKKEHIKTLNTASYTDLEEIIAGLEKLAADIEMDTSDIGIKDFRIHDLRRTYGSLLLRSGADLPTIGKALGHIHPSSTHVYARVHHAPLNAVVDIAFDKLMKK